MSRAQELIIKDGLCVVLYAYDIGFAIDLPKCAERLAATPNMTLRRGHRAPRYFDYSPEPLSASCECAPLKLGAYQTRPAMEMLIYDFGAVSVSYFIPFSGPLDTLTPLTRELSSNPLLLNESHKAMESLVAILGDAVTKASVSDLVEDYVIIEARESASPVAVTDIPVEMAHDLAQVLRAENEKLSEQEVADAMAHSISYARDDVAVVDWNAALVVDRDPDDVRAVLEFANVELLELRHLDRRLDQYLDQAYEMVTRASRIPLRRPQWEQRELRRLSEMQLDGAILFERVSNAPKLLGDQYLARVYRLASQRFHVAEWNATILRKLEVIENIHARLSDRSSSQRLEWLEWIIIILIVIEIVLSLVTFVR